MTDWTAAQLPSFAGRTVIITGANSGLGEITARELAATGATIIMAVRNTQKGHLAARNMRGQVEVRELDLQNLSSVREFADGVDRADILINNAGVMGVTYAETIDGFESQIGTNHLGHFVLTNLLLPKLADRVVTVSSMAHWAGRISLDDLNWKKRRYRPWLAYAQSKLANLLFTSELQRRLQAAGSPLRAVAAHPGYSHTNLQGATGRQLSDTLMSAATSVFATNADFGARQTLYAASRDIPGDTFVGPRFGSFGRTQAVGRSKAAHDAATATALWQLSEQLTKTTFPL
ncbi:oxidoreductase [Mycobacterium shigaense]|uniref:Short-chain dehydrogenase n=1 Tax=Mycobacterium shigaense TaxID=722731 RepID=A0A1Z4EMJ4_9MYCO|nr:oxidoreductase [Mycobacterium shigaense]MEA1120784.1 oxidoreductase [Mycobacterium shigaense]PRI12929.1 oxidoreductase [Mycobacterium shigaense]BAX94122.1 short-chain dehydrogenase [Mycobacterium shigaense]